VSSQFQSEKRIQSKKRTGSRCPTSFFLGNQFPSRACHRIADQCHPISLRRDGRLSFRLLPSENPEHAEETSYVFT
jgi:hypothetical protein